MGEPIIDGAEHRESLAIIGIGLRLPMDSNNVEEFWNNLISGTDGIITVPKDRWNAEYFTDKALSKAGKIANSTGGFIKDVNSFDNEFFNLAPYTCHHMDPQQRILLEVTFEALENAGLRLKDVSGSETSVFIGGFQYDHLVMALQNSARDQIGSATVIGTSVSSLANRISYHFNLKGPSVTVDTACSASLIAFHHACQSIWNNEAQMAIAGGVNLMLRPESSIELSKGGFLGSSGFCNTFDSSADGYVRGEGCAIIVMKTLKSALEHKDRIYALVKGTAINHDGFKREGYSVPSVEAQINLLSSLYSKTGTVPIEIDYVECHGTGTKVGDPIEVKALAQVIGKNRSLDCYIGSIKTNIGHLEGAAGIAALVKAILIISKKQIPPNLHFNNPRSDLYLEENHFLVPTKVIEIDRKDNKSILVGVNSFGAGGANAHAILSEFVPDKYIKEDENMTIALHRICLVFILSHKSILGLKSTVMEYIQYLKVTSNNIIDICYTLMTKRTIFSNQIIITAYTKNEIIELLEEYLQGKQHPQIQTREILEDNYDSENKLAFVYSGQGGQWIGMGKQLMNEIPLFKLKIMEIDKKFQSLSGWSLLDELNNSNESISKLHHTNVVQPLLMSIQIALTYVWKEYFGLKPDGIIGHSVGEIAAAFIADIIDLDTAVFIIYQRSMIQSKLSGRGKMLAVGINEYQANKYIEKYINKISIATINGPRMLTIAGDSTILDLIASELELQDIFNAYVKTDVPYHTSIMEEIQEEMINRFQNIQMHKSNTDFYSTTHARKINELSSYYWYENIRKPVLFNQTIQTMINDGYKQFIEIGPHPILISGIKQLFADLKINDGLAICSLKRQNEIFQLFQSLGIYFIHNKIEPQLHFDHIYPRGKFLFDLPQYKWQHKKYSFETNKDKEERLGFKYNGGHPFLRNDYRFCSINKNQIWEININLSNINHLSDHVINNRILFPAVGYIEIGFAVGKENSTKTNIFLEDLLFESAIILSDDRMESISTRLEIISPEKDFIIYTKSEKHEENSNWNRHASGKINTTDQFKIIQQLKLNEIQKQFDTCDLIDVQEFYSFMNDCGISYGKYYQGIEYLWYYDSKILSKIQLSEDIDYEVKQYIFHPALFDSALHGLFVEHLKNGVNDLYLPHSLERVIIYKTGFSTIYSYMEIIHSNEKSIKINSWIYSIDGDLIAEIYGLTLINLSNNQLGNSLKDSYECKWIERSILDETISKSIRSVLIFVDDSNNKIAQQISKCLTINCRIIHNQNQLKDILPSYQLIIYIPSLSHDFVQTALKYLKLVQLIIKNTDNIQLRLITQNSAMNNIKFDHVLLCGMCRVIQTEYPNLNIKFIDIDETNLNSIEIIFDDLFNMETNLQNKEITFRNGNRYVRRLNQLNNETIEERLTEQKTALGSWFNIEMKEKGFIDKVLFRKVKYQNIKSNEIEINVHAAGINFKDVLNLMGRLSDKAIENSMAGNLLGLEISGIITDKGSDVHHLNIGDEVIACVANGFSGKVITAYTNCMKKPKHLNHIQGATIPIAYVTAYYGLKYLGRITKDDTVLIHSAAGGVGIGSINIAKYFGAKIIATVSTKIKREFLEKEFDIPSKYIFNSRSITFYDDIMNVTNGQGVDIIINSFSGSQLDQTLKCLNSFGRFIEIGKSSIYDNKQLCLERFGNNISYFVVDIDRLSKQKAKLHKQILDELQILFEQKHLEAIPHTVYSINNISSAFQTMSKGNHIGKLIVNMENEIVTVLPEKQLVLSNHGVFIITGGTSGLGLIITKWIVEKGINKLVLISRNGIKSERDQNIIDQLKSNGVSVQIKKMNIKSNEEIEQLFADVTNNFGTITGIIHSAAILRDAPIENMSEEDFLDVIQTKAIGAFNLHNVSLKYSNTIKYFIMFSSISAVFGIYAQINYAAANYFLDTLAEYRQQLCLPATSVNFGTLGEYAGMLNSRTDKQGIAKILVNHGFMKNPLHKIQNILELSILHESPSRIAAILDWNKLKKSMPSITVDLRFSDVLNNIHKSGTINLQKSLKYKILEAKDSSKANEILQREICVVFSKILNLSESNIDIDQSMDKLGFDSLSYAQVRTWLLKNLNTNYPILKLIKGISIRTLTEELIKDIKSSTDSFREIQDDIEEQTSKAEHVHQSNHVNFISKPVDEKVNNVTKSSRLQSLSLNNAHILGIGTSNPSIENYTTEVFENIKAEYVRSGISDSDLEKLTRFYQNSGIEKKYCCTDFSKTTFTENEQAEYFNEKYKRVVPELAFQSASQAIQDWGGDVKLITHIISCSCTGVLIPDPGFLLIQKLGLNNTTERISVNMMGCFGGLTTMKTARALALQNPQNRVLMVCTEVCSIHFRPILQIDTMLGCAIFADGSGAMIIGCHPAENEQPLFEIIQTGAFHIPDTLDLMNWSLNHDGWLLGLSPFIPLVFGSRIVEIIETFLKNSVPFSVSFHDCDWLMHPGGKNILLSVQDALNIPMEKNISAWNVLKDYGNMSSATILFVMDNARKSTLREKFSIAIAFGPGLSVEMALMRKL